MDRCRDKYPAPFGGPCSGDSDCSLARLAVEVSDDEQRRLCPLTNDLNPLKQLPHLVKISEVCSSGSQKKGIQGDQTRAQDTDLFRYRSEVLRIVQVWSAGADDDRKVLGLD